MESATHCRKPDEPKNTLALFQTTSLHDGPSLRDIVCVQLFTTNAAGCQSSKCYCARRCGSAGLRVDMLEAACMFRSGLMKPARVSWYKCKHTP